MPARKIARFWIFLLGLSFILVGPGASFAQSIKIQEWTVPFEKGRPRDPSVAPDGSVWFVGQQNHYLGRFDAESQRFRQVKLDDAAGPHNLIVGQDGIVWYAGNRKGYIGRHDPITGRIDKIKLPPAARDPHTLVFDKGQRHIWFTAQWSNLVGRLNIKTRHVDLIKLPTPDARPYGIIVAPNGTVWIALLGSNKLASVNPASLELSEHLLPDADAGPRRLIATPDNQIYYVDYSLGELGHLDPVTGKVRRWQTPSGTGSGPYAMAVDATNRIWFVETGAQPNRLVGFDVKSEEFVSVTAIPSGAGSVRHMVYDAPTHSLWFGTDQGTLAQARLPD
jgi:virginiamycin B lyase